MNQVERWEQALPEEIAFWARYARNCLDHSYKPSLIIRNMVRLVKPGCWVVLRHERNVAENARYAGLHQWNFDVRHDDFVIWRPEEQHNVTEAIRAEATVDCHLEAGWVICLITKRAPQ